LDLDAATAQPGLRIADANVDRAGAPEGVDGMQQLGGRPMPLELRPHEEAETADEQQEHARAEPTAPDPVALFTISRRPHPHLPARPYARSIAPSTPFVAFGPRTRQLPA